MQPLTVLPRRSRFGQVIVVASALFALSACGGAGTGDGVDGGPDGGTGGGVGGGTGGGSGGDPDGGTDGGLDGGTGGGTGDASVGTAPMAADDAYAVTGNLPIDVPFADGVLSNDALEGAALVGYGASASTAAERAPGQALTTTLGGSVTMSATGAFSYEPPAGQVGADSFAYTLSGAAGASVATVAIDIADRIYFVDADAAPGGDGTLTRPFTDLSAVTSAASGDVIHLGSAAASYSSKALALGQRLLGQGITVTDAELGFSRAMHSRPLPAAGTRPTMSTLTLASSSYVRGVDVAPPSGSPGLLGSSASGVDVAAVSVRTSDAVGVSLHVVSGDVALGSVTTTGGSAGIELIDVEASFLVGAGATGSPDGSGGTIANTTNGVVLSGTSNVTLRSLRIEGSTNNGVLGSELGGTLDLLGCSIVGPGEAGLSVVNQSATLDRLSFQGGRVSSTEFVGLELVVLDSGRIDELSVGGNLFDGAGGSFAGHAISVVVAGTPGVTMPYAHALIANNTISGSSGPGIRLRSAEVDGLLDATVISNTVAAPTLDVPTYAIRAEAGSVDGASTLCLELALNIATGAAGATGVGLRLDGPDDRFGIVGLPAESTSGTALRTYVSAQNPGANGVTLVAATSGFTPCIIP